MSSSLFQCHSHVIPCSPFRSSPWATASRDPPLRQAIKQYVPRRAAAPDKPAVTIIGAAASACPKELYEPLWDALQEYASKTAAFSIRGIWIADVYFQCESGLLNVAHLGNEPQWFDWSRDILHFVTHFRDHIQPPIVGIGHSIGAAVLVNLATMHPQLFTTLTLMEPMVKRLPSPPDGQSPILMAYAATIQKEHWPSRKEAVKYLKSRQVYQTWDPRVVDLHVKHGLRDQPEEQHGSTAVALKTPARQIALGMARPAYPPHKQPLSSFMPSRLRHPELATGLLRHDLSAFYRPEALLAFSQLAQLTPRTLFMHGQHASQRAQMQADFIATTGKGINGNGGVPENAVRSVTFADAGHYLPFEKVNATAAEAGSWIGDAVEKWRMAQVCEDQEWYSRSLQRKQQLPEDYSYWMRQQFHQVNAAKPTQAGVPDNLRATARL